MRIHADLPSERPQRCADSICLAPLGEIEEDVLSTLEWRLHDEFALPIRRLKPAGEPVSALDRTRSQWNSIVIMNGLADDPPEDALCVLAVTQKDLFIPILDCVYGTAGLHGRVAVVSLARLRQEFYGLNPDRYLLLSRLTKVAVHEVGHILGLEHCRTDGCVMSLSMDIHKLDLTSDQFCRECSTLLRRARGMTAAKVYPRHTEPPLVRNQHAPELRHSETYHNG
jgi:archaemetzincin